MSRSHREETERGPTMAAYSGPQLDSTTADNDMQAHANKTIGPKIAASVTLCSSAEKGTVSGKAVKVCANFLFFSSRSRASPFGKKLSIPVPGVIRYVRVQVDRFDLDGAHGCGSSCMLPHKIDLHNCALRASADSFPLLSKPSLRLPPHRGSQPKEEGRYAWRCHCIYTVVTSLVVAPSTFLCGIICQLTGSAITSHDVGQCTEAIPK